MRCMTLQARANMERLWYGRQMLGNGSHLYVHMVAIDSGYEISIKPSLIFMSDVKYVAAENKHFGEKNHSYSSCQIQVLYTCWKLMDIEYTREKNTLALKAISFNYIGHSQSSRMNLSTISVITTSPPDCTGPQTSPHTSYCSQPDHTLNHHQNLPAKFHWR